MSELLYNNLFKNLPQETQNIISEKIKLFNETKNNQPAYYELTPQECRQWQNTFKEHEFKFNYNNILVSLEDHGLGNFRVSFYLEASIDDTKFFYFQISKELLNQYYPYSTNITIFDSSSNEGKKSLQIRDINAKNILSNPYDFLSINAFNFIIDGIKNSLPENEIIDLLKLNFDLDTNNIYFKTFFNILNNPIIQSSTLKNNPSGFIV